MSDHARLSPSGAHRWLRCPGSVALEVGQPDHRNKYSDEGTLAHLLGQLCLQKGLDTAAQEILVAICSDRCDPAFELDEDMQTHVQTYVDYVRGRVRSGSILQVEQRLPLDVYVPESFGTADAVVIHPSDFDAVAEVIDLKYGTGIRVDAPGNEQLMLYALGVLEEIDLVYDVTSLILTIVQPRLDHISTVRITTEELRAWGRDHVRPRAVFAMETANAYALGQIELSPGVTLIPGEKQCQWCKVKATCRARADQAMEIARSEFSEAPILDVKLLSLDDLARMLPKLDELLAWISNVREHAYLTARSGQAIPGYKLVEGKSNRAWIDETKADTALRAAGLVQTELYKPPEMIGIPAAEKLLKKMLKMKAPQVAEVLAELVRKPPGRPTLVPESDPRPQLTYTTAAEDFDQIEFEPE